MALTKPFVKPDILNETSHQTVVIDTPSRLHFTLIDLHGGLGRIDGGCGVALRNPRIKINIRYAGAEVGNPDKIKDNIPPRLIPILETIRNTTGFHEKLDVELVDSIPKHIGLGSNTQLALALAKGVTYFMGLHLSSDQLGGIVSRGGTSGIGVATFQNGGFVMDAGHPREQKQDFLPSHFSDAEPPKLMMRAEVPENWYFVMTTPFIGQGLHGWAEADIFKKHCPIPRREVEKLSHIILMKLLPAVAEKDIASFGEALRTIQGLGFKRIENELQDRIVKDLYPFYYDHGALGAGLSSFGPTTYALVEGNLAAKKLSTEIETCLKESGVACDVQFSNVDNHGAKISIRD